MDIKETFLKLTSRTYPHKTEYELFDILPQSLEMDEFGNIFTKIGESDVMFTSHLDTATSALTEVKHVFDDKFIKSDGKSILGADDKAGVTIMLYMIEKNVPGLYYFFLGEEVGCIGSGLLADKHKKEKLPYINKVISFDRRGTDSVITYQSGKRTASDKFAQELAKRFNDVESTFKYKEDPTGVCTDSIQFTSIYPECTNISVGYYSEHTFSEKQDIEHLIKLAEACTKIDWNSLPVERDPSKVEYRSYGYGYAYGWNMYGDDYYDDYEYSNYRTSKPVETIETVWFMDEEYRYVSSFDINKTTGKLVALDISSERIDSEQIEIYKFLDDIELEYNYMKWDGLKLKVVYSDGRSTESTRQELEEYIESLDLSYYLLDIEKYEERGNVVDYRDFIK